MQADGSAERALAGQLESVEHFDVIVVGAGLSGVGAGYHLQKRCPEKSFVILEGRAAIGGTWDLFRYPGVRSDSDMFTLGYVFKPWRARKAIADGHLIREYIEEAARENGIETRIRFGHRVKRAAWSSEHARWTVEVERGASNEIVRFTCGFLYGCAGYYRYEAGYAPTFPGADAFEGRIVHPQKWTDDIDYEGKRVVVIGSGATAMTLVPAMSPKAAHVVMLQRSPTYVASRPAEDPIANALRRMFPLKFAYALTRWVYVLGGILTFWLARQSPKLVNRGIIDRVRKELGPDYDVAKHFTPRYDVWDQRLCLVPDSDLFVAIRSGRVSVVTDQIETFTRNGIRLLSGQELDADLVVTATGIELQFLGGIELTVDGHRVDPNQIMNYKGVLFSDVPNLACTFGYTNASWTLKADLVAAYVCRVLRHMDAIGAQQCTPRRRDPDLREEPFLDFSSGYVQRALSRFPKQGSKRPWRLYQNYVRDLLTLRFGAVDDGSLEFTSPRHSAAPRSTDQDVRAMDETR